MHQTMSNKLLFGKELSAYDEDIDELLSKLTEEEIQQLSEDFDPDNTLLPPSQRCRDQTAKSPTGPFNREKLLKYLIEQGKNEKDWDEAVPYEKKVRGSVFVSKKKNELQVCEKELSDMGFDLEFGDTVNEVLDSATEAQLVDLAAVLGFTGMLNQIQYNNSLAGQPIDESAGFSSVVKAEHFKPLPDEKPNPTDVEESIKRLEGNDAELIVLNLNNIKTMSLEVVQRLCSALSKNVHLRELHMAATSLTDPFAEPFIEMLHVNHTLQLLNLESNFLKGPTLLRLIESVGHEKSAIITIRLSNQRQSLLGVNVEQELTNKILENHRLLHVGLDLETSSARVRTTEHLQDNRDRNQRQVRRNKN